MNSYRTVENCMQALDLRGQTVVLNRGIVTCSISAPREKGLVSFTSLTGSLELAPLEVSVGYYIMFQSESTCIVVLVYM